MRPSPIPVEYEHRCRSCGRWFWSEEYWNPGMCPDCEHDLQMEAPGKYPPREGEEW